MGNYDHVSQIIDLYKASASEANALAAKIKAARDKPDEAIDAILSTSEDPQIVKWRAQDQHNAEQIAAATRHRDEQRAKAKAYATGLLPQADETFNVDEAKGKFAELRANAHKVFEVLGQLVGKDNMENLATEYGIVEVTSLKGASSGSRGSTNIRRPRIVAATFDGKDVEKDGKASFTLLTQYVNKTVGKIEADVLRDAAFAAAGTNDLSSLPAGTVIEFTVSVKGNTHTVTVTTLGKPEGSAADSDESDEVTDSGE